MAESAYWLVPAYKQAAKRYKLDWKLVAAIDGARTRFGDRNCSTDEGTGFYRLHLSAWKRYRVNAGTTKIKDAGPDCREALPPANVYERFQKPWKPGNKENYAAPTSADPYQAVDSIFTAARILAKRGAYNKMKDGWDYSGSRANNCTPEDRDGRVYFPPRFEEPGFGFGDLNFNPKQAKNIPKKMLRLYVAAGKRFGVDWRLLAAIGYNETRHNAIKATSSAGAQGAMQFMPPTFATYAVDGNGDGRKVITDPADSVFSAANYVRALAGLSWVGNDPVLIMASYNAGPGNTQNYGGVPPFKETRDYVINGVSTMKALGWKRGQPVVFKKKGKKFVVNTGKGQTKGKRIKAHGYQGKPQKDAVSRAVAWDGERRMSSCYVAVVWDWYKAIEKYPPKMSDPTAGAPAGTRKVGGNGKFVPCPKKIPHDTANPCYVDKRIIPDLLWIHRKYKIFISDGLAGVNVPGLGRVGCGGCHSANGEHSIGLGVDIVPSPNGGSWDLIDKLAYWAEPSQGSPRKPFRWVGYNGDKDHGRGHHLHLSWDHGPGKLYYPAPWVLTMNIKQGKVTGTKTRKGAGKKKAKKRAEAKKKAKRKAKKKGKRKRRR